jgi:glycosyltransferase involved in cell wall biosynthesis
MNVALDATPLTVSTGGITRYTAELSRALASEFPEDTFHLLSDQPFSLDGQLPTNLKKGRAPSGGLRQRWWSLGLAAEILRVKASVFHGTDFAVPYLPTRPAVMTLHDLSPWRDPEWRASSGRVRRRTPLLLDLGLATMVITPTESIRREAIGRFRMAAARVVAVPLAASENFHPVEGPKPERPYFLYVGVLEPRKNLQLLIDSWREVRKKHPVDLVLAGRRRDDFQAPPAEPGLSMPGEIPESDLAGLYSGAVAVVYPTLYEGFGLPVLEAMQCGAPVITSTDPAVSEVAGDAAVLLEVGRKAAWTEAMTALLENTELRRSRSTLSLARSRGFSWSRTAQLTREVYEEARKRFGS